MTALTSHLNRLVLAGYRPKTIEARRQVIGAFAAFITPHHLHEATRADVEAFLSRPLSSESRRAYRSHLIQYFCWAVDEGLISEDPTAKVPSIRIKKGTPRPMSDEHFSHALSLAGPRMRAWLLLMAFAGLRCLEVAALRPKDLLEIDGHVLLHLRECKGGGTATVPAHPDVLTALAILPVKSGAWWTVEARTVSNLVNSHLKACGVTGTAHSLRHLAGTAWYRASGHDLLATAELLRHASVTTTQVYAKLDPTRSREVVRAVRLEAV